jgi:hypothetical protein
MAEPDCPSCLPFTSLNNNSELIDRFNTKFSLYTQLDTEINDSSYNEYIIETENILNREYILLIIWFIITIIIVTFTIIGLLSTEINNYILYPALGFLIYIIFYIFKNIYKYFKK